MDFSSVQGLNSIANWLSVVDLLLIQNKVDADEIEICRVQRTTSSWQTGKGWRCSTFDSSAKSDMKILSQEHLVIWNQSLPSIWIWLEKTRWNEAEEPWERENKEKKDEVYVISDFRWNGWKFVNSNIHRTFFTQLLTPKSCLSRLPIPLCAFCKMKNC